MQSQAATENTIEQELDSQIIHSEMAERVVLGGLMRRDNTLDVLAVLLTKDDFFNPANSLIFNHILSIIKFSKSPNLIAVAESLELSGELNQIGGLNYLNFLLEGLPADSDIQNCAIILRERLALRTAPIERIDEELLLMAELFCKHSRERLRRNKLPIICTKMAARAMRDTGITSEQLIDDAIAELIKLKNSV